MEGPRREEPLLTCQSIIGIVRVQSLGHIHFIADCICAGAAAAAVAAAAAAAAAAACVVNEFSQSFGTTLYGLHAMANWCY